MLPVNAVRNRGTRHTRQRQVILEELGRVSSHPTAEEVYRLVRERLPRISLATVYRNLELLSEQGRVARLEVPGSQRRFDGATAAHHHIRCVDCGRIADLWLDHCPPPLDRVRAATDFEVLSQRVEFTGRCPECAKIAQQDN